MKKGIYLSLLMAGMLLMGCQRTTSGTEDTNTASNGGTQMCIRDRIVLLCLLTGSKMVQPLVHLVVAIESLFFRRIVETYKIKLIHRIPVFIHHCLRNRCV